MRRVLLLRKLLLQKSMVCHLCSRFSTKPYCSPCRQLILKNEISQQLRSKNESYSYLILWTDKNEYLCHHLLKMIKGQKKRSLCYFWAQKLCRFVPQFSPSSPTLPRCEHEHEHPGPHWACSTGEGGRRPHWACPTGEGGQRPHWTCSNGEGGQRPHWTCSNGEGGRRPHWACSNGEGGQRPHWACSTGEGGQRPHWACSTGEGGQRPHWACPTGEGGRRPEPASPPGPVVLNPSDIQVVFPQSPKVKEDGVKGVAEALVEILQLPPPVGLKLPGSGTQKFKSRKERFRHSEQVRPQFKAPRAEMCHLFIDDVVTTGATVEKAHRACGKPPQFLAVSLFHRSLLINRERVL